MTATILPVAVMSVGHTAQATVVAGTPVVVSAAGDGYVDSAHASRNYGVASTLYVDGSPSLMSSYLKFDLTGYAGQTLTSAQLQVRTTGSASAGSPNTQTIRTVANDAWTETALTYGNRPSVGAAIGSLSGTVPARSYSVSLSTAAVQAELGQALSIAIDQPSSAGDGLALFSRQATTASYRPTLVLQFAATTDGTSTSGGGTTSGNTS